MNNPELCAEIAQIHNKIAEIAVRGDDTLRMAEALARCRSLVKMLSHETCDSDTAENNSAEA